VLDATGQAQQTCTVSHIDTRTRNSCQIWLREKARLQQQVADASTGDLSLDGMGYVCTDWLLW
jgi:hypothetical protein